MPLHFGGDLTKKDESFHLLMVYFDLVVVEGIYHYWIAFFSPGDLGKWR